jgi:5'(3')-deoxyribonucleotidase
LRANKPIIAVDIDDVIPESTEAFRKVVNAHAGFDLRPEHYKIEGSYWGYYDQVWKTHGVAELVDRDQLMHQMHVDQSHVPLLPGSAYAIGRLQQNFTIVLVTARDPKWQGATSNWLSEQFGTSVPALYFSEAHRGVEGSKTKGEICRELGAQWMIDDNPGHCQTVLDCGVTAILFGEYGWHIDIPVGTVRCKDWQVVLEYLDAAD